MSVVLGEILVSLVAGGGLVISGILLIAVSKYQIKKYAEAGGEPEDSEVQV